MPKIGLTVIQYVFCWIIIFLVHSTPTPEDLSLTEYWHYFYVGSLSGITIFSLIKFGGKNYLAFVLCSFEFLAILLQLASYYANLTKEANWFYDHYRDILERLYHLEIGLLTIAGIYGFGLLVWTFCWGLLDNRGNHHHKSLIWPLFYERRQRRR